jgi:hypothetical protein
MTNIKLGAVREFPPKKVGTSTTLTAGGEADEI